MSIKIKLYYLIKFDRLLSSIAIGDISSPMVHTSAVHKTFLIEKNYMIGFISGIRVSKLVNYYD